MSAEPKPDPEAIRDQIVGIENQIRWRTPLAEPPSTTRNGAGLRAWQRREEIRQLEEQRAALIQQLRDLGIEFESMPDDVFEFDVIENRAGPTDRLVGVHAHHVKGCRHLAAGKDEFKAAQEAKRDHLINCLGRSPESVRSLL